MASTMFSSYLNFHLKTSSYYLEIYLFTAAVYYKENLKVYPTYINDGVSLHHSSIGLESIMINIFFWSKHKAYIFEHVAITKETANMVAFRQVYRKQTINAGASNLRMVSCIPYPHIHQSQ